MVKARTKTIAQVVGSWLRLSYQKHEAGKWCLDDSIGNKRERQETDNTQHRRSQHVTTESDGPHLAKACSPAPLVVGVENIPRTNVYH